MYPYLEESHKYVLFSLLLLAVIPFFINEFTEPENTSDSLKNDLKNNLKIVQIPFMENIGQINNDKVKYYASTFAGTIYVSDDDLLYLSNSKNNTSWATKEVFVNGKILPSGQEKSPTVVNYFKGDSKNWKSNIPTYQTLSLGEVWPLIQVELKTYGNNMEKIFTVYPGANISDIKNSFEGITNLGVDETGQLVIDTDLGQTKFSKPIAYQTINGKNIPVQASYITDENAYGFSVEKYDVNFPLVIDPLIASTFVGGMESEAAYSIKIGSSGDIYIAGDTLDSSILDYPVITGAYNTSHNGALGLPDVFVSVFSSNLSTLKYSTFIGGDNIDDLYDMTLDSSDNVYITGETYDGTVDFPTVGTLSLSLHNGVSDIFVSKISSDLSTLSNSILIGGTSYDAGAAIVLDSSNNIYIAGHTDTLALSSPTFPSTVVPTYIPSGSSNLDIVVSKFPSDFSTHTSLIIWGSGEDHSNDIALDSSNNIYITGETADSSIDYYTTSGAYNEIHNGDDDGFVTKIANPPTNVTSSTLIGGSGTDHSHNIVIDSSNNVYISGHTKSSLFPTITGGYSQVHSGSEDVFVTKISSNLAGPLLASTFIGGSGDEFPFGMVLDSSNNVYITGKTNSTGYPITTNAYDATYDATNIESFDGFVSRLDADLTALQKSTFIGGSGNDVSNNIALDSSGNVYITGGTHMSSTNYPTTINAYTQVHTGTEDVFVSKLDADLSVNPILAVTMGFQSNYDPSNWSLTLTNSDGSVDTTGAPAFIKLIGGDNQALSPGDTDYTIVIPRDGTVKFNWNFDGEPVVPGNTGPLYDPSGYLINGNFIQVTNNDGLETQSGSVLVSVSQGDVFGFRIHSNDNIFGPGIFITLENFEGPSLPISIPTITDSANTAKTSVRTAIDTPTITDSATAVKTYFISVTDTPTISDTIQTTKTSATEFISVGEVLEDESFEVTLPENDQGSENTIVIDLPTGVAGTVTVFTTDAGASDPDIEFLGTVIDIDIDSTSPSFTYSVILGFTDADLDAANLTLDQVVIYHDDDNSGTFEEDEALITTITPSSPPGPYIAQADNIPSNSKFAIGGVVALALLGLGSGGDSAGPPSLDSSSFTLLHDNIDDTLDPANTSEFQVGTQSNISMGFKMPGGLGELNHLGLYANIADGKEKNDSDTYIFFDKYTTPQVTIHDPHGFFKSVNVNVNEVSRGNLEVDYSLDFAKLLEQDDVVFEVWNNARQSAQIELPNLLKVIDNSMPQDTIQEITKDEVTQDILQETPKEKPSVPTWVKSNAGWWSKGEIDDKEFTNGIGYLIQTQIIDIPELLQTNVSPEKTENLDIGLIDPPEEFIPVIPDWVKNNALWWSEDKLTDDDFLIGIKYLLQKGIIQVKV